jgi:hypothetical protein
MMRGVELGMIHPEGGVAMERVYFRDVDGGPLE